MPDVSILIPTLRRPHFLREAIASALAQDHASLEVVVGDDGDLGEAVVEEFGDPRLRYLRNREPRGMVANWNGLLDAARGEHVALLMDDDRLLPGFVSACLGALRAGPPGTGVAFTNHFEERGGTMRRRPSLLAAGRHDRFLVPLLRTSPVAISAALIRADAWRTVRPLPDTPAADMVLFARLAERGWAFHYVDEPLMVYRRHDENFSAALGFRSDVVRAWESLRFEDPEAEAERRRLLARALVGRAGARLREGDARAARADLERAALLSSQPRGRRMLLSAVASTAVPAPVRRALLTAWDRRGSRA